MTPIRALQTSPAKANDLFTQLAQSGGGALKTRERLFSELKDEMELHARLEEEHLLPVMKKHGETKGMVAGAVEGMKRTRALLAEIEAMPRDGDAFVGKIAELKTMFQQHRRDDKNDLLPALLKALGEEESQVLADKLVADRAEVERVADETAARERAVARAAREQAAEVQATAEEADRRTRQLATESRKAAKAAAESAEARAEAGRELVERGVSASADLGKRAVDQFTQTLDASRRSTQALGGVAQSGALMARSWQGAQREWMGWAQTRFQTRVQAAGELMACRSPQDLIALQTRLVREEMESLLGTTARVANLASGAAEQASRAITARA